MSTSPARATLMVFGLFGSGLLGGAWTGVYAAERARDPYSELDAFVRVLSTIEASYVEEVDAQQLLEASLRGMVDELDAHSRALTAAEYGALRDNTRGDYEGIGIEIRRADQGPVVIQVLDGGPAARDGIQVGDQILAVDGSPLAGLAVDDVADRLKGPRGAPATLTVSRPGWEEPRSIRTVRDRVHTPAVERAYLRAGLGYIRLAQFQQGASSELATAWRQLEEAGHLRGVILDLRDHPGGLLTEAVAVVDMFLDAGAIVTTRGRVEPEEAYLAEGEALDPSVALVVVINGSSASASEIVAAALKQAERATLVGTRTYGKGSVQTVFENRDGSALKLTTGRYYTLVGDPSADLEGVEPDVVVPWPSEPSAAERLRELIDALDIESEQRAQLTELLDELEDPTPARPHPIDWAAPAPERVARDPQLQAALALVD